PHRLKLAFISWAGEKRLRRAGTFSQACQATKTAMRIAHHSGSTACWPDPAASAPVTVSITEVHPHSGKGPPAIQRKNESLIPEQASRIVAQFSHAQLPDRTRWRRGRRIAPG